MRPRYDRGFTLLELLVVVFIVGLISAMAVLSLGSGGREQVLEREALRIKQLLAVAAQEAVLQGREIGFALKKDGYHFLIAGQAQWEELKGGEVLRPRTFPKGVQLEVVDGYQPEESTALDEYDEEEEEKPVPQLVFFSTGEATPFELKLSMENEAGAYRFEGQANGAVALIAQVPDR